MIHVKFCLFTDILSRLFFNGPISQNVLWTGLCLSHGTTVNRGADSSYPKLQGQRWTLGDVLGMILEAELYLLEEDPLPLCLDMPAHA